ncbi:hypothetical protein SELMODRAFT_421058 [Selaginella moellendorffii]|uniref:Peptidoglycan binding-like domain-containing protein n=1 Tax=Selaginella moellendorffii TaxID=88036 RepID=D8SE01_SELML|nr:hypothetical protein SELMODRAFT_421058 [Selaginella moellendorffii]
MPCLSCIVTGRFPAAAASSGSCAFQIHGNNLMSSQHRFPSEFRGAHSLRKGIAARTRFRSARIVSAQESSSGTYWEREEARWLREEERWKREEQRWLREEKRWNSDREYWAVESSRMKEEITSLRKEVERLGRSDQVPDKHDASPSSLRDVLVGLLRTLSDRNEEAVAPPSQPAKAPPMVTEKSVESIKFVLSPSETSAGQTKSSSNSKGGTKGSSKTEKKHAISNKQEARSLKYGAEGDDVKLLQEALAKLGFYCGDDDMEYASFSSGTDRAVKSWQSSIGAAEDGIVTAQVLSQLISEHQVITVNTSAAIKPPESPEVVDRSSTGRVYLLGENRWEDPERLLHRRQANPAASQNCYTCRGEGQTLCSECDGTGELNVEEQASFQALPFGVTYTRLNLQFLDWAGEGAKCPYCDGSGTVVCEDCKGKGVAAT